MYRQLKSNLKNFRINFLSVFIFMVMASGIALGAKGFRSLDVDGDTTIGGTLDVTGDTSVGNLSASGTLGVTGNTTLSGTLDVTGATTVTDLTASGAIVSTATDGASRFNPMTTVQRDALASPTAGDLVFNTDDGKYNYYDGSSWTEVGSGAGGGSGEKNYISQENSLFESGTGDWATFDDVGSAYVDGTGGTASAVSVSVTTTSGEAREGSQSLKFAKSAADGQGEGVSVLTATIDPYAAEAGTLYGSVNVDADHASYDAYDVCIKAYDVTNSEILTVWNDEGSTNMGCIPAGVGTVHFVLHPSSTTRSIRLSLFVATTNAAAYDLFVDDWKLGPDSKVLAFNGTNWKTVECDGSWTTNATYTCMERQIGDSLEMQVAVALTGAPGGTSLFSVNLPSGYTIDTDKLASGSATFITGANNSGQAIDGGTRGYPLVPYIASSTSIGFRHAETTGSTTSDLESDSPFTFGSGDSISASFTVPIEGWNASGILSTAETAFLAADAQATLSGNQSIAVATATKVTFDTEGFDDVGYLDTTNNRFVVTKPGRKKVRASLYYNNYTADETFQAEIRKNGTAEVVKFVRFSGTDGMIEISGMFDDVQVDDYFEIFVDSAAETSYEIVANDTTTFFEIEDQPKFNFRGVTGKVEFKEATSSVKTPTSTNLVYLQMTGNKVTLPLGSWFVKGIIDLEYTSTYPQPAALSFVWATENGDDTTTDPDTIAVDAGITTGEIFNLNDAFMGGDFEVPGIRVTVTETTDLYLVPNINSATPANNRVTTYIYAERLQ